MDRCAQCSQTHHSVTLLPLFERNATVELVVGAPYEGNDLCSAHIVPGTCVVSPRFRYEEDLLSPDQERALIASFERRPFREFEFRGRQRRA